METGGIKFERGLYKLCAQNDKNTRFDLTLQNKGEYKVLTDTIRIELDNGFHDRSRYFDYWLYFKNDAWLRSLKTGLAQTDIENVCEGNASRKLNIETKNYKGKEFEVPQHLVIVYTFEGFENIIVDVFKDFYISKRNLLRLFINEHFREHYNKKGSL